MRFGPSVPARSLGGFRGPRPINAGLPLRRSSLPLNISSYVSDLSDRLGGSCRSIWFALEACSDYRVRRDVRESFVPLLRNVVTRITLEMAHDLV